MIEYEKKFLKLLEFCMYLIPDDNKKNVKFLDELSGVITSEIFGVVHSTI